MSTLNAGISINGGNTTPQTLRERELFLNTQDMSIWSVVPSQSAPRKLNSNQSDSTLSFSNTSTNTSMTSSGVTIRVGNFDISGSKSSTWKTRDANTNDISTFNTLDSIDINQLGRLVLHNKVYGSKLPDSGVQGQVFFLLK